MNEQESASARGLKTGARGVESEAPEPSRADGPERGRLEQAIDQLTRRPQRDPETGQFVAGNTEGGTTLARSAGFWEAVAPAKREVIEKVRADLAVDGDAAATLDGLIDAYAEATLLRRSLFIRLAQAGGVVTAKGRMRAAFGGYLSALDRERRLALDLGLERRAQKVPTLAEYIEERQREQQRRDNDREGTDGDG